MIRLFFITLSMFALPKNICGFPLYAAKVDQMLTDGCYAFTLHKVPAFIIVEILDGADNIQVQQ